MNAVRRMAAICIAIAALSLLIFCISDAAKAIKAELGASHAKQCSGKQTKNCLIRDDKTVQGLVRASTSTDNYAIKFDDHSYKINEDLYNAVKVGSVVQIERFNGRIYTLSKGRVTYKDKSFVNDVSSSGFNIALLIAAIVALLWIVAERKQQENINLFLICGMLAMDLIVAFTTVSAVSFVVRETVIAAVISWIAVFITCNAMNCYLSCGRSMQPAGE